MVNLVEDHGGGVYARLSESKRWCCSKLRMRYWTERVSINSLIDGSYEVIVLKL